LQDRDIAPPIRLNNPSWCAASIPDLDFNVPRASGAFDDVRIGDDLSVLRPDHA